MQFNANRETRLWKGSSGTGLKETPLVGHHMTNQYDASINFYTIPPFGKISLEESEDMVAERLNRLSTLCITSLLSIESIVCLIQQFLWVATKCSRIWRRPQTSREIRLISKALRIGY